MPPLVEVTEGRASCRHERHRGLLGGAEALFRSRNIWGLLEPFVVLRLEPGRLTC